MKQSFFRYFGIIFPSFLTVALFVAAICFLVLPQFESVILQKDRQLSRELSHNVIDILNSFYLLEKDSILSKEEAQAKALRYVRDLRYGRDNKNYFWINDLVPRMIMHPYRSDLDGKDLRNFKDPNNNFLFVEMVEVVKKEGQGYVNYFWQWKDNPQYMAAKESFVQLFKPWNWVVGTGVYAKDVELEYALLARTLTWVALGILVTISLLSAFIAFRQFQTIKTREDALKALMETKEKYEAVFRSSPDPMLVYDNVGRAIHISPAFKSVFGWEPEELLGHKIDFLPPGSVEETMSAIDRLYRGQNEHESFESKRLTKDGRILDVSVSASLYKGHNHTPQGMVVALTDITKRKQVEKALMESERRFRSISSNALDGIVMIDSNGVIIFWNNAASKIFGWTEEEVLGKDLHKLLSPLRYHEQYINAFDKFRKSGTGNAIGQTLELYALHKKAYEFPVEISISPVRLSDQWCAVGIIRDITDRKFAEKALKDSESRYRALFESGHDGMFLLADNVFTDCNRAAIRMFGCQRKDIIGRIPSDFAPEYQENGESSFVLHQEYVKNAYSGEAQFFNWKHKRPDGYEFDTEVSLNSIKVSGGNFLLAVVRDVTDRVEGQRKRAQLEAQLQQAQKMEAIGTLASGIAHDFNNILQVISGYVQILKNTEKRSDLDLKHIDIIDDQAQRAAELVRGMLTFSRKVDPELKLVDLNERVTKAVEILKRVLPPMIETKTDLSENIKLLAGDSNQIEQVLLNLGTNAGDAMQNGGTLLFKTFNKTVKSEDFKSHMRLKSGDYVILEVKDTGIGMDEKTLEHVFDPFYTTKEIGKGTGLGLSMVYGIVKGHKGAIDCFSEPNKGTVFSIYFPVAGPKNSQKEYETEISHPEQQGTETVLLVDDERNITEMTGKMMSGLGYTVLTAASGEEALEVFKANKDVVDLVILDLGMPGMGGSKALEKLLEIDPNLKIIIASGYSSDPKIRENLQKGAAEFVAKPYRFVDMLAIIRKVLGSVSKNSLN